MRVLLSETTSGEFSQVLDIVRYWRGHHPSVGKLHFGWDGAETVEEARVVRPIRSFKVVG